MWLQHRRRGSYIWEGRQFSWQAHLCILWNVTATICPWGKGVLSLSLLSLLSAAAINWHLCTNDFILNLFSGQTQNRRPMNYSLYYGIVIIMAGAALQVESEKGGNLLERMNRGKATFAKRRQGWLDNSGEVWSSKQNSNEFWNVLCVLCCRAEFSVKVYLNSVSTKGKQAKKQK